MTLQVKLFGSLDVRNGAAAVTPRLRARAQRLLAYLLLHRHVTPSRDAVAFVLMPDRAEHDALGSLRRALSDLRAVLPPPPHGDYVMTDQGGLRWNPEVPCRIDVEEFERSVRQATPAALHQAVATYTGDLLADWTDEWVHGERERLRHLQAAALRDLVAHHRALGEYAAGLDLARRALALDPLSEAAYRDVIALRYEAGDRASALAEYDRLRDLLRIELGVEPMPETQALVESVTQGLPLTWRARTAMGAVAHAAQPVPKLIGREREFDQLSGLWTQAASGRGRFSIVSGEAGIGKTHLIRALAEQASGPGGLVLLGHSYEFERALPYQALVEILRSAASLLGHLELPSVHRAALARLVPDVMGAAGSPGVDPAAMPSELRAQLFEALLQTFLTVARGQPLLLLFEDVHWAAESTLDWLTYIAPRLGDSPLLVIITYRIDEVGRQHALGRLERRLTRKGTVSALRLGPLSREATRELVTHLSGLKTTEAARVADRLFEETAGNPFFLEEVVRGLIDAGQLTVAHGRWMGPFVEAAGGARVPLPDSLRSTIIDRVERLTEMSRMFLTAAAVAGRVFPYEVVQHAGGWPDEQALGALEDLLARGFIQEEDGRGGIQEEDGGGGIQEEDREAEHEGEGAAGGQSGPGAGFGFAHHLVQEAIYAGLTQPRRAYWHRRLADAIHQLRPDDREALAHHFAAAGDHAMAVDYFRQAGRRAMELYAYADAWRALEAAWEAVEGLRAEAVDDVAAVHRRIEVLFDRVALMPIVGRPLEDQQNALEEAATLLVRHPDPRLEAMLHLRRSNLLDDMAEYEAAAQAALEAHHRYEALGDRARASWGLLQAGRMKITLSQNRLGRELMERALVLYQMAGDTEGESLCLSGLAWSGLNLGEVEYALAHMARALQLSEQRADKLGMARSCFTLAAAWGFYYSPRHVRGYAERSLRLYNEIGYVPSEHRARFYVGVAQYLRGEMDQAQATYEQVLRDACARHDAWTEGWTAQLLGRLALARGDVEAAEEYLQRAHRLRSASGERANQISDLAWLARLSVAQGRIAEALGYTQEAMSKLDALWSESYVWEMPDVLLAHAEALAITGDEAGARSYIDRAHETLMGFAAQIVDPSVRLEFEAYPLNARVIRARHDGRVLPLHAPPLPAPPH